MPVATAEQADFQAAHAEAHEHTLDYSAEYGHERANLFGIEGTIDELKKMCPHADKLNDGTFSLEQQNDYVIRILNSSGKSVKPEHFDHISQRLTEMGQEVKITIREDEPEKQSWLRNDEKKDSEATKVRDEFDHARRAVKDSVQPESKIQDRDDLMVNPESPAPQVVRDTLVQDYDTSEDGVESLPEAREVSVEEWFDVMAAEYAEHQRRHTVETVEKPVDKIIIVSAQDETLTPAKRVKAAPKRSLEDQGSTEKAVVVHVEGVSPEEGIDSTPETGVDEAEDIVQIEARVEADVVAQDDLRLLEPSAPHDASNSEVGVDDSADDYERAAGDGFDTEDALDELPFEMAQKDRGMDEGVREDDLEVEPIDLVELPEVLEELFARFDNENVGSPVDVEDIQDIEPTEGVVALEADHEFISQIEAYITQLEAAETTMDSITMDVHMDKAKFITEDEEDSEEADRYSQPRQTFVQVLELAQQIQIHRAEMVVASNGEADSDDIPEQLAEMQEAQDMLEAELYEACEQFLESIGVEPTEEKVQALVERVLKIDFEALEKEQKFSIQQLAKMGTREYKLDSSFKQVIAHAKSSLWQVIGTFAVQHIAVDSMQNETTSV